VFTSRTIYRLADRVAVVSSFVRRRLGNVAIEEAPQPVTDGADAEMSKLRGEIVNFGSSWAALCMCLKVNPENFSALLFAAGVPELTGKLQLRAFDACTDGYSVYRDARRRHKL
jgi:hypothetical protein